MIELSIKKVDDEKCEGNVTIEGKGIDLVEEASSGIVEILKALKDLDDRLCFATVAVIANNMREVLDSLGKEERYN